MAPTTAPAVVALLVLLACHGRPGPRDVPAVITEPTAESRAELRRVVSGALHGAPVTMADDALVGESTLVVERVQARDASGVPLSGRERGRPERFRLVKNASACVLIHEGSGRRFTLGAATCSPE